MKTSPRRPSARKRSATRGKRAPQGEPQYEEVIRRVRGQGLERLGLMSSWAWHDDPKRLVFMLARYKFVAKMMEGLNRVLEIGCGDGFGTRVVAQAVRHVVATDFDRRFIESAKGIANRQYSIEFRVHDVLASPVKECFDGVYSLDVLEHIPAAREDEFMRNLVASLSDGGVCIIGMPSLESQAYASKFSRMGHVNCKSQPALRDFLRRYFGNVFMFSMNDELIHTGYSKLAHYNLALCCGPRD